MLPRSRGPPDTALLPKPLDSPTARFARLRLFHPFSVFRIHRASSDSAPAFDGDSHNHHPCLTAMSEMFPHSATRPSRAENIGQDNGGEATQAQIKARKAFNCRRQKVLASRVLVASFQWTDCS
ncbi:hypothetical protein LIA77_10393 [Sarocladium implicatum]|nr:hypothetical protein LIA77_10393 [Sarocladium implicatum]